MQRTAPRLAIALLSLLAVLLVSAPAPGDPGDSPAPGTASGTFSIDGKSIQVRYAYAMAQPNSFEEKKTDTAILVTDRPVAED